MLGAVGRVGLVGSVGRVGGDGGAGRRNGLDFQGGVLPAGVTYSRAGAASAVTSSRSVVLFDADAPQMTDLGLLLEPAGTNIARDSAAFALEPADWAEDWAREPVRPVAPDGTATGVELIGPDFPVVLRNAGGAIYIPGGPFTFSVYVQSDVLLRDVFPVLARNDTTASFVDYAEPSLPFVAGDYGLAKVAAGPGDWWRLSGSVAAGFDPADLLGLYLGSLGTSQPGKRIRLWGLNITPGDRDQSFIPTGGSAGTRGQPTCTVTVPPERTGWRTTHNNGLTATGSGLTPGDTFDIYAALLAADRLGMGRELQRLEWLP